MTRVYKKCVSASKISLYSGLSSRVFRYFEVSHEEMIAASQSLFSILIVIFAIICYSAYLLVTYLLLAWFQSNWFDTVSLFLIQLLRCSVSGSAKRRCHIVSTYFISFPAHHLSFTNTLNKWTGSILSYFSHLLPLCAPIPISTSPPLNCHHG